MFNHLFFSFLLCMKGLLTRRAFCHFPSDFVACTVSLPVICHLYIYLADFSFCIQVLLLTFVLTLSLCAFIVVSCFQEVFFWHAFPVPWSLVLGLHLIWDAIQYCHFKVDSSLSINVGVLTICHRPRICQGLYLLSAFLTVSGPLLQLFLLVWLVSLFPTVFLLCFSWPCVFLLCFSWS